MATTISITPGRTWVDGETVTAAKLNCFLTDATIDSDDIVPVGTLSPSFATTAPTGYVFVAGKSVGNASSNSTERANADTEDLFTLLWTNLTDTTADIQDSTGASVGRGGSAAADFAANNRLVLPDARGRVCAGLDTMSGTSSANRLTDYREGLDGDILGDTGGEEKHLPIISETASHDHPFTAVLSATASAISDGAGAPKNEPDIQTGGTTSTTGGGQNFNITQPTIITTYIIKL